MTPSPELTCTIRKLYEAKLKISAPVAVLDDEQKDHLQKLAFTRIVEAYKQVTVAGSAQVRSSLLAYLGVEGHELTMCVLYRLFEEDRDLVSSTNATISICI